MILSKLIIMPCFTLQNKTTERRQKNLNGLQNDVFEFSIFRFHEMWGKNSNGCHFYTSSQ